MSVLTRKILPPVFGIATIGWIIGGTIWFDNHQPSETLANAVSNTSTVNRSIVLLQTATPPNDVCCDSSNFQALNLFFKKDKFRFAENEQLQTYFKDLTAYLQHNPTVKLKIAALRSNTEGSKISKNRLAFMTNFLKNKKLNINQFIFEDQKTLANTTLADAENLKNQRIEIRLLTP